MTRKQLLSLAKSMGMQTEGATLESVRKFVTEYITTNGNIDVVIDGAKTAVTDEVITKSWAAVPRIEVQLDADTADEVTKIKAAFSEHRDGVRKSAKSPHTAIVEDEDGPQNFYVANAEKKSFNQRAASGETALPDADAAQIAGAWAKMAFFGHMDFAGKSSCIDICRKANVSYDFASGGFAVPSILRNELIRIRPRYSALAQLLPDTPVDIAGESVPRRSTGVTVYSPGEGVTATESNPTGDQVKLTPYEMVALNTVSKTQLAKSEIDFGDFITSEMMYAIAKKEEEIYFLGDGTSTYFNQVGLAGKLAKLLYDQNTTYTVAANAEYLSCGVRGSGNLLSELADADFIAMLATPMDVENPGNLKWVCNRSVYYSAMLRLAMAKGGCHAMEVINGVSTPMYYGFPVIFSNALPATDTNGQIVAYFGDFAQCTKRGTVPGMLEMSVSTERYWELRKIGYQLSVHKAVNCHDLGTANSTKPTNTVPFAALAVANS